MEFDTLDGGGLVTATPCHFLKWQINSLDAALTAGHCSMPLTPVLLDPTFHTTSLKRKRRSPTITIMDACVHDDERREMRHKRICMIVKCFVIGGGRKDMVIVTAVWAL
jgi:hypothetical protein